MNNPAFLGQVRLLGQLGPPPGPAITYPDPWSEEVQEALRPAPDPALPSEINYDPQTPEEIETAWQQTGEPPLTPDVIDDKIYSIDKATDMIGEIGDRINSRDARIGELEAKLAPDAPVTGGWIRTDEYQAELDALNEANATDYGSITALSGGRMDNMRRLEGKPPIYGLPTGEQVDETDHDLFMEGMTYREWYDKNIRNRVDVPTAPGGLTEDYQDWRGERPLPEPFPPTPTEAVAPAEPEPESEPEPLPDTPTGQAGPGRCTPPEFWDGTKCRGSVEGDYGDFASLPDTASGTTTTPAEITPPSSLPPAIDPVGDTYDPNLDVQMTGRSLGYAFLGQVPLRR